MTSEYLVCSLSILFLCSVFGAISADVIVILAVGVGVVFGSSLIGRVFPRRFPPAVLIQRLNSIEGFE